MALRYKYKKITQTIIAGSDVETPSSIFFFIYVPLGSLCHVLSKYDHIIEHAIEAAVIF